MSTRPTGAHPSPEEVDALLDPTGGDASVAEHVSGCSTCADVRAALEEVRSLLKAEARRVPEPPADLDARIGAALAGAVLSDEPAAALAGASSVPSRSAGSSADVVPLDSRRRGMPRWLAVAAGVAVVGGLAFATGQLAGGGLGGADTMTAGSAARDADAPAEEAAPNVLEYGRLQAVATGTDYDRDTLAAQVDELVAAVESGRATGAAGGEAPGGVATESESDSAGGDATQLSTETGITDCLDALGVGGQTPVAVDLATYQSAPAAVIVLPADGGGLDVWVVSLTCGSGDEGLRQFTHLAP